MVKSVKQPFQYPKYLFFLSNCDTTNIIYCCPWDTHTQRIPSKIPNPHILPYPGVLLLTTLPRQTQFNSLKVGIKSTVTRFSCCEIFIHILHYLFFSELLSDDSPQRMEDREADSDQCKATCRQHYTIDLQCYFTSHHVKSATTKQSTCHANTCIINRTGSLRMQTEEKY